MRTRTFVYAKNAQGRDGWRPEDNPEFDPGDGFLVAHDTTEHLSNDPTFRSELIALGVTQYGRGYRGFSMAETSAGDLAGFLHEQEFKVPKAAKRWYKKLHGKDEVYVQTLLAQAYFELSVASVFGGVKADDAQIKRSLRQSAPWIRLGFRLAQRVYRHVQRKDIVGAFESLMKAVNADHFSHPAKLGERLRVDYDPRTLKFNLTHLEAA